MANRSKKVVLSARIDPYLKAAIELLATSKKEKIVKILESCLEDGLGARVIKNPFKTTYSDEKDMSFLVIFTAIWSDNEILYKLRAGSLGADFAGEELANIALKITNDKYFDGEFDVYGDLNGDTQRFGFEPRSRLYVNLELVEEEWPIMEEYVRFLENNKPFWPTYSEYKRMRIEADTK